MRLSRVLLLLLLAVPSFAQSKNGGVKGTVVDPTGAVIPGAIVSARDAAGKTRSATADGTGNYALNGLPSGSYAITGSAKGFAKFQKPGFQVEPGKIVNLNIELGIEEQHQQVNVEDENAQLDVDPGS